MDYGMVSGPFCFAQASCSAHNFGVHVFQKPFHSEYSGEDEITLTLAGGDRISMPLHMLEIRTQRPPWHKCILDSHSCRLYSVVFGHRIWMRVSTSHVFPRFLLPGFSIPADITLIPISASILAIGKMSYSVSSPFPLS